MVRYCKGLVVISGCVRDPRREKWMDSERYWRFFICIVGIVIVGGILGYHGLDHAREDLVISIVFQISSKFT